MKNLKLLVVFSFAVFGKGFCQSVGIGTTSPNVRAALHVMQGASPQGVLLPTLTTLGMNSMALTTTEQGMLIYNIDSLAYMYWDGAAWKLVGGGESDNLGNHTMTQNLSTNSFYLSNSGTDAGIYISTTNNVAIGHASPLAKLHLADNGVTALRIDADVDGDNDKDNAYIEFFQDANTTEGFVGLHSIADGYFQNGLADAVIVGSLNAQSVQFATNGIARVTIAETGNMAIGGPVNNDFKLYVYGLLKSDGITEISDQRLKTEITTLEGALEKVKNLRGVNYRWKEEAMSEIQFDKDLQVGLIAQEVESVFPELVDTDSEGMKSVQYSKLVAVLIEAIKVLDTEVNRLEVNVDELYKLKAEVEVIKKQLSGYGLK